VAFASSDRSMSQYIEQEINKLDDAIASSPSEGAVGELPELSTSASPEKPSPSNDTQQRWFLRNFWLRTRATVGYQVPALLKLEIVPELELLWQRDYPTDWGTYKP